MTIFDHITIPSIKIYLDSYEYIFYLFLTFVVLLLSIYVVYNKIEKRRSKLKNENIYIEEIDISNYFPEVGIETPEREIKSRYGEIYIETAFKPTSIIYIRKVEEEKEQMAALWRDIKEGEQKCVGVDIENDSHSSYFGAISLIQINHKDNNYIFDAHILGTNSLRSILRPLLQDIHIVKIFHGGSNDLLWIQRDFGYPVINIFDTQKAYALLFNTTCGLHALWESYTKFRMPKELKVQFQSRNWGIRPIPADVLNYAAVDSHYLPFLRSTLILLILKTPQGFEKLTNCIKGMQEISKITYDKSKKQGQNPDKEFKKWIVGCQGDEIYIWNQIFKEIWEVRDKCAREGNLNPEGLCPSIYIFQLSQAKSIKEGIAQIKSRDVKIPKFIKNNSKLIDSMIRGIYKEYAANPALFREFPKHIANTNQYNSIRKTMRRKKIEKDYSCKKPVYQNCRIMAPDGEWLCNCDGDKINWYLSKNLGKLVSNNPTTLQLLFEPSGRSERTQKDKEDDKFYTLTRKNECVACGKSENLHRYHVIPMLYRQYFPLNLKSHRSHDVLLLCFPCHEKANRYTQNIKDKLSIQYSIPKYTQTTTLTRQLREYRKLARTIYKSNKIPEERIQFITNKLFTFIFNNYTQLERFPVDMKELILEHTNERSSFTEQQFIDYILNNEEMRNKCLNYFQNVEVEERQVDCHGKLVMEKVSDMYKFIIMWRQAFVQNMKPKFMPEGWNIEHRIDRSFGEQSSFYTQE